MTQTVADFVIIGSGPSSFAALSAIPKHLSVTIIDLGKTPSDETKNFVESLATDIKHDSNPKDILNKAFARVFGKSSHIGEAKKYFGDGFAYDASALQLNYEIDARASIGMGGFSSVWGSTVLPYSENDLGMMSPLLRSHFQNGYREIAKLVRIEGQTNAMSQFQDFSTHPKSFEVSTLSKSLLKNWRLNSFLGKFLGAHFIHSSVMVGKSNDSEIVNCVQCGLCHVGCPFNLIWQSSNAFLDSFSNRYQEISGRATRFEEGRNHVSIFVDTDNGNEVILAKYLLIASGPLSTSKLLLDSLKIIDSIQIDDSQTYFKHGISFRRIGSLDFRNTLAELMLTFTFRGTTTLLAQLYSRSHYSDYRAGKEFPLLANMPSKVKNFFLSRIVTQLVYLPGESSNKIQVERTPKGIQVSDKICGNQIDRKVSLWGRMFTAMLLKGVVMLPFTGTKLSTGGGNHFGRSRLKISDSIVPICGVDGVLHGHKRVYVVDGSSIPKVPAGPITFTIMANAREIVNKLIRNL